MVTNVYATKPKDTYQTAPNVSVSKRFLFITLSYYRLIIVVQIFL